MNGALAVLAAAGLSSAALLTPTGFAEAKTLTAGAGQTYLLPSAAAAAAEDGDTIAIVPGTYFDCIATPRAKLVIEGISDGVVLTDKTCQEKAILVLDGDGGTVRNLTLQRARVPDGNGAGIRLEAPSLLIERVTFENDQVGLLASAGGGTIQIENSQFSNGGTTGTALAAIMVPAASSLLVRDTTFTNVAGGQVVSAAAQTDLLHDTVTADGAAALPISVNAGTLTVEDGVIAIGPNPPPHAAAITLSDDAAAMLRRTRLVNRTGASLVLLLDWSWNRPILEANMAGPGDRVTSSDGVWRHRIGSWVREIKDALRAFAGRIKRLITSHL